MDKNLITKIIQFTTSNKVTILLLVVIFLIMKNTFTFDKISTDVKRYNEQIKKHQQSIDSLVNLNSELQERVMSLHTELELIDGSMKTVNGTINEIKVKSNEKIISVDSYSNDELAGYFQTRYDSMSTK